MKPRPTIIPDDLDPRFAPIALAFALTRGVTQGRMMSSYGLKVHSRIFAMFGRGRFVAKLPKHRVDALVEAGRGERFDPGHGRRMKEWIALEAFEDTWLALAEEAWEYVKGGKP